MRKEGSHTAHQTAVRCQKRITGKYHDGVSFTAREGQATLQYCAGLLQEQDNRGRLEAPLQPMLHPNPSARVCHGALQLKRPHFFDLVSLGWPTDLMCRLERFADVRKQVIFISI